MNRCFVFGALNVKTLPEKPDENDFIIAADKGTSVLEELCIKPNLTVGDFDSLGFVPKGENVIRLNVRKDDTDVSYAVKTALEKGYKSFVFYGCLGGNLSHTLANLQIAKALSEKGCSVVLYGENEIITVISNTSVSFKGEKSGRISVLSLSDESTGVTIENLSYTLQNATLNSNTPLGVSNEFVGCESRISVEKGCLAIIEEK